MVQHKKLYLLLLPCVVFLTVFFLVPLLVLVSGSIYEPGKGFVGQGYYDFFAQKLSRDAYLRSLSMGGLVTLISMVFSYPAAMAIIRIRSKSLKSFVMTLVVLPLMTNPVARTFAWLVVLGRNGLINNTLLSLGLIKQPERLLYTNGAVFVGLLQLFMPFMILSLISALENVSDDYSMAARSLGASGLKSFWYVELPLTIEGLVIGGTLVFTGAITAYVTPAILGGSRILMLSTLLYQRASVTLDWEMATTIAMVMFLTTLGLNYALKSLGKVGRSRSRA